MTAPYNIIQPPFTLKFREMSKRDLKEYFLWFIEIVPERIRELTSAIADSKSPNTWQPGGSPASVEALGEWLATHIETRKRSQSEAQEIASRSKFPIQISDRELTNLSFSLAMDAGMYFSQALMMNHPCLRWEQPLENKAFADYGQPVLVGFGPVPLNPIRIAITFAYGVARGTHTGGRLREVYDYWSSRAGGASRHT